MTELTEGKRLNLDFKKLKKVAGIEEDILPVVVQDAGSGEVLILAYANQEALDYTLTQGVAAFWSTSRNELWVKGKTSGDELTLIEVRINCEQNSLLYRVNPKNVNACHTQRKSCYYRKIGQDNLEYLHD